MDWITAALALMPTSLLLAQGISCLRRVREPTYIQRFGLLSVLLWSVSFILGILLVSATLVPSSEFGIVMVQGSWAWFGMTLVLVGSAIGVGMGLHVCRLQAGRPSRWPWLLGAGLLVGVFAASRLQSLHSSDLPPLRLYAYDLWWPPLLVWLSLCLLDTALTIIKVSHRAYRLWLAMAVVSGLAFFALSQPLFGDASSEILWKSCLLMLVPISMSLVTWLCWPGLIGPLTPHQPDKQTWLVLPRPTWQQIGFLIASILLSLGLAVLPYSVSIDHILLLDGYIIAWLLLAEAIAGGPLSGFLQRLVDQQQWSASRRRLTAVYGSIGSWLGSLLSVPSMPVLLGKALMGMVVLVALNEVPNAGKTLIQPFKTPALPERTEFGKTGSERDEVGKAISDQVVNTLGLFHQQLRQEVVLASQPDAEDEAGRKKFELMSVSDSAQVSAAVGKSAELDIGGVKIPLGMLFTPVQGPIRRLLGVRVINGSVQADHPGYSLLASSDAGETWRITLSPDERAFPPGPISPESVASLAAEFAFHIITSDATLAPAITKSWTAFRPFKDGLKEWKKFETKQDYGALSTAIERFREAAREDPGFAFAHYRLGRALQKDGQPGAAVRAFQASLQADPNLVPAYIALASTLYDFERTSYLGEIGSPLDFLPKLPPERERIERARALWLEVLRLPMRGDSVANLGSAYYGLCRQAFRQGRQKAYHEQQLHPGKRSTDNAAKADPQELEVHAHGKRLDRREDSGIQDSDTTAKQWHYMAYYYCKRAEALYANLSAERHANPEVKNGEAYVLYTLGVILVNFPPPKRNSKDDEPGWKEPGWKCWVRNPSGSLYSREGLQYFMRAMELLPDDYRIRCSAARTAYARGDRKPLERLEADAMAHLNLANGHRRFARVCAWIEPLSDAERERLKNTSYRRHVDRCASKDGSSKSAQYYKSALDEYDEVIRREPMNIEALTGYAYTVWERLIHGKISQEFQGEIKSYAERAVGHALKAAGLSSSTLDNSMAPLVRSRLGMAFLAQGHPKRAIEELEEAIKPIPNHPAFHDIHWALAQAYFCAASIDKRTGFREEDVRPQEKSAVELLGDIRVQERTREFQLYSHRPGVLDSPWGSLVCDPRFRMESTPDPPIRFSATSNSTSHHDR